MKNYFSMSQKRKTKQAAADEWYKLNRGNIDWSLKYSRDVFRQTSTWKHFVASFKKNKCDCCSLHSPRLAIHHLDPKNYDVLDKSKFRVLCYKCHTIAETLSRKKNRDEIPEYWRQFLTVISD